jgi:hypothetical protein
VPLAAGLRKFADQADEHTRRDPLDCRLGHAKHLTAVIQETDPAAAHDLQLGSESGKI